MTTVRLIKDATAILSMRESDFDAYSAYGEVVDNSIQADAKNILLQMNYSSGDISDNFPAINEIAFGDDGCGMDSETLHRCMQLGYSTRYNDRSGIGRFGVGMTLAAINQCKHVEIYSKQTEGDWLSTYFDLDEITTDPPLLEGIPEPVKKKIPKEFQSLVGKDSGTLVIWSKYDRQPESALKIIEEMKIWFGRTYRKFIWKGIYIKVNGEKVFAIDPLYVNTEMTKFYADPPAFEYTKILIPWEVSLIDKFDSVSNKSDITIKISLINEKLRPYQGSGQSIDAKARYIDRNEGVSILRNEREVFYGHIPYFGRKFVEIDRWWGCEISFNAELDRAFTVKNIKRGAIPNSHLKNTIYDKIKPTIKTAVEEVQNYWRKREQQQREEELKRKDQLITGHEDAEKVASITSTDKSEIDKDKDIHEESKKIADEVKQEESEQKKAEWATKFASQPFTILDKSWKGPDFFETKHLGGNDVILYNNNHNFIQILYKIIQILEEEEGGIQEAKKLKNLIDLLLISYSKAEAKFEKELTWTTEQFIENLKMNWGQYLSNYLYNWLKEQ